jgi:hypothetical protein
VLPLLGVLAAVAASPHGLQSGGETTQALAILVTIAALTGASLTYHDLVSEGAILRRDWRVGISTASLLLSKVVTVGAVCLVLAAAMTAVFSPSGLPPTADGLAPAAALFLTLFAVMVASAGLGLMISALSRSLERAVTWSTGLAVLQVILNGSLFELTGKWRLAASVLPSRQGFDAMASYADMNRLRPPGIYHDALWTAGVAHFWHPLIFCGLILAVSTSVAMWVMAKAWRTGRSAS